MARIVGIAGSTRQGSTNGALLQAAAQLAPPDTTVEIATIAGIPLYDADTEKEHGVPPIVTELKDRIAAAAGLLLVTPEYNASVPGVLKNAVDWLSRPPKDIPRVFGDKPVALLGATTGAGGTRLAQAAWLPVLRALGARVWSGRQLYVAGAAQVFDPDGVIVDEKVRRLLAEFITGFARFAGSTGYDSR
jgi:NAD(P)H-dependent FMN reductase